MEKRPYRGDVRVRRHIVERRAGIPSASGIGDAILISRSRWSGPVELQWVATPIHRRQPGMWVRSAGEHVGRERPVRLEPVHLLLSSRPRGLHSSTPPECLRCLVVVRSVYNLLVLCDDLPLQPAAFWLQILPSPGQFAGLVALV
jgi:hypothetical protein